LLGSQGNSLFVVVAEPFNTPAVEDMTKGLAGALEDHFKIESVTPLDEAWVIKLSLKGLNNQFVDKVGFDSMHEAKSVLKAVVKNYLNRKDIKASVQPNRHKNIFCTIVLSGADMPEPEWAEVVLPATQEYGETVSKELEEEVQFRKLTSSNIQAKIRGLVRLRAMLETEEAAIGKSELENELAERAARGSILSEVPSME
jgi:hypothetical protein